MNRALKKYFIRLLLLALFTGLGGWLLLHFVFSGTVLPEWPFMIIGFVFLTAGYHLYLIRVMEHQPGKFSLRFLAATGLKMLLYVLIVAAYLLLSPGRAVPFLVAFLFLYLLFTAFEIIHVLHTTRSNNRK